MGLISRVSSRTYRLESLAKPRVNYFSNMPKSQKNILSFFKPKQTTAQIATSSTSLSPSKITEKLKTAKLNESQKSEDLENLSPSSIVDDAKNDNKETSNLTEKTDKKRKVIFSSDSESEPETKSQPKKSPKKIPKKKQKKKKKKKKKKS